jgi:hypothetical protein
MKIPAKINSDDATLLLKKPYNIFSSKKEIIKTELVYLLYYMFESEIIFSGGKIEKRNICVDTVSGDYAFFKNIDMKYNAETEYPSVLIKPYEARNIAELTIKSNLMFEKGKGKKIDSIKIKEAGMIEYPYRIGYYKRKNRIDFDVVDAVNGKLQGAKMKPTFIKLIMQ